MGSDYILQKAQSFSARYILIKWKTIIIMGDAATDTSQLLDQSDRARTQAIWVRRASKLRRSPGSTSKDWASLFPSPPKWSKELTSASTLRDTMEASLYGPSPGRTTSSRWPSPTETPSTTNSDHHHPFIIFIHLHEPINTEWISASAISLKTRPSHTHYTDIGSLSRKRLWQ